MGGIAHILKNSGHHISGSDMQFYPPMSDQLKDSGIELISGYKTSSLPDADLYIIGNALSRGNESVEYILENKLPFKSGPEILGEMLAKKIVIAVSDGANKNYLFNSDERIDIVNKALFKDLKLNPKKISIVPFSSLTTDLCKKYKSNIILRGLRAVSDFEYEFQLAGMNRKLNNNIETIFLMSDVENQIISSRFVKEIIKLNGDIKKFTTKSTIKSLKEKYA